MCLRDRGPVCAGLSQEPIVFACCCFCYQRGHTFLLQVSKKVTSETQTCTQARAHGGSLHVECQLFRVAAEPGQAGPEARTVSNNFGVTDTSNVVCTPDSLRVEEHDSELARPSSARFGSSRLDLPALKSGLLSKTPDSEVHLTPSRCKGSHQNEQNTHR